MFKKDYSENFNRTRGSKQKRHSWFTHYAATYLNTKPP